MAPKEKKTKAQIAAAASSGGKAKKKKWSKGKQQDKLNNSVIFDTATFGKLMSEIPKSRLITPSAISEKLHVTVSLARQAIRDLEAKGLIRSVTTKHHAQMIYTRCTTAADE